MLNFERRRSTYGGGVLAAALYPLLVVISENPANHGQCLNPKLPALRGTLHQGTKIARPNSGKGPRPRCRNETRPHQVCLAPIGRCPTLFFDWSSTRDRSF